MKGDTIELYKNGRLCLTFFNAFVNTDTLDEGVFTIYVISHIKEREIEDEYIYTTDEWDYRIN